MHHDRSSQSFIGRRAALAKVERWLSGSPGLLTIVGPGGVGKTRLAREGLARFAPGGVLCELADARSKRALCTAIASRLELTLPRGVRPVSRALVRALAALDELPPLLVLDNVEQLIDPATALVAELREELPNLALLITSRERLGLDDEQICEIGPLPCAGAGDANEALALLEGRAARWRPEPTADDHTAYSAIVERLQGLPLAIELAAARLEIWSPGQLLEALDDPIPSRALGDRSRSRAPRHRSITATLAWSWRLLDQGERRLLGTLSCFAGSFDWPAVFAVIDDIEAADRLQALLHKSLLTRDARRERRFRLHALVRDFTREETRRSDPALLDEAATRHARYYLDRAAGLLDGRFWHPSASAVSAIEAELPNLLDALQREVSGRLPALFAAGAVLCRRGLQQHYLELIDAIASAVDDAYWRAALLNARGFALRRLSRLDEAREVLERAVALAATHDAPGATEASALGNLANIAVTRGDGRRALELLERASAAAPAGSALEAVLDCDRGRVHYMLGERQRACTLATEALVTHRALDNARSAARTHSRLAFFALDEAQLERAREHLEAARALAEQHGFEDVASLLPIYFGNLARLERRYDDALAYYDRAGTRLRAAGNTHFAAVVQLDIAITAALTLDPEARQSIQQAREAAAAVGATRIDMLLCAYLALVNAGAAPSAERARSALAARERAAAWTAEHTDDVLSPPIRLAIDTAARIATASRAALAAIPAPEEDGDSAHLVLVQRLCRLYLAHLAPPADRCAISLDGSWLRPAGAELVSLARRAPLARLLRRLVEGYRRSPQTPMKRQALIDATWPDERLLEQAADNRLRNALSTLRKLGLANNLSSGRGGVRLDDVVIANAGVATWWHSDGRS